MDVVYNCYAIQDSPTGLKETPPIHPIHGIDDNGVYVDSTLHIIIQWLDNFLYVCIDDKTLQ